ncbi:hypothetical protein PV11_09964 [Exophiala sideris]|uniref:Uncharacterized protein n=1 Tax=Exophiala sideris TaxID=1016849 RepID=A0A0D1WSZ5_9EURO|nr:hypothetical protein PV11_09964 [Exophiala sideris]
MCVTEIWTYSECGCRYNHSVLCRLNRGISSPVFAPSILYSTDESLQESGVGPDATSRQTRKRAKPAEPKKCPHHSFVQKTFLNPICDDCLLAEINSTGEDVGPPPMAPASNAENGEGLVWDSEVKVEIESQTSIESPIESPSSDAPILVDSEGPDDTDRRILESHVEITVEEDCCSVSAEDPSSPLLASSQTDGSSPSSSLMTSPPTSTEKQQQKPYVLSPPLRRKRYGLTFHDGFSTDFDDGEDEEDDTLHAVSPPSRGRPAVRRNGDGTGAQRSVTDPITALPPVEGKTSRKSLSRMKSFKSISSAFRHSPKSKQQDTRTETGPEKTVAKRSRSRNPFRAFRKRKSSHQYTEAAEIMPGMHADGPRDIPEPTSFAHHRKTSALPPRKSSMKHWKPEKDSGRKEMATLPVRQSLREIALAPLSPTGSSWSWKNLNDREESERPILTLPLEETPFDAQSELSDFEVESTAAFNMENAATPALVVPATPDSFKVNPMRAMIEGIEAFDLGFDLGLDDDFPKKSRPETELIWNYGDPLSQVQYLGLAITSSEPELVEAKQEQSAETAMTKAGPTEPPSVPLPALPQEQSKEVMAAEADEAIPTQAQPAETLTERSREPSPEDSARIISMYGWSTTETIEEPEQKNEVVLDVCDVAVVLRREPVIEEESLRTEESKVYEAFPELEKSTTTPPGSPSPAAKALVDKASRHPPRKSSLKRLTGFNHAHMPFAEFDFPVPRSPLLQQEFETEDS